VNKYIEFSFKYKNGTENIKDLLIAELSAISFDTFWETKEGLKAYVKEENIDLSNGAFEFIKSDIFNKISYEYQPVKDKNWNNEWEQNFKPVMINNEIYIRAPFHYGNPAILHEIVIEPKMSFGTGHHLSTVLVLESMLLIDFNGKTTLDMGCGTGILSILAAKKGSTEIIGIDNNEWAFENAKENIQLNNAKNVTILHGDVELIKAQSFDIILANINKNVLLDDIPHYADSLNPEGLLIMSGILNTDFEQINTKAEKNKLRLTEYKEKENWTCVTYKNKL
jgi:ribosomal protein L11 methyltransferase